MALGLIPSLILYIIICAWFVYTFMIADPSTSTMANVCTIKVPRILESFLVRIFGEKAARCLHNSSHYFLTAFYLIVVLGSWSIMLTYGYTWISQSPHVSSLHEYSGYLVFVACLYSYHIVHKTPPGYITPHTFPRYDSTYPYDDLLFPRDRVCPTVGILRLPRSKYDRTSQRHIARFDHYCGWVDNAVGEENYRFFLSFLAVHVGMCAYGTTITWKLFQGEISDLDLMNAVYIDAVEGVEVRATRWVVGNYMLRKRVEMATIMVLMAAMAVALGLFLGFHLYIAARGMTTNEYYKWKQVKRWYWNEKGRYEKAKKDGTLLDFSSDDKGMNELKDVDVGCVGPVGATSGVIDPQRGTSTTTTENTGADENKPMPIIDPGQFPKNIYNLGMIENFKEIIFPRSLRKDAMERWALSCKKARRKKHTKKDQDQYLSMSKKENSTKTKDI